MEQNKLKLVVLEFDGIKYIDTIGFMHFINRDAEPLLNLATHMYFLLLYFVYE